jgi:hypothetical protein
VLIQTSLSKSGAGCRLSSRGVWVAVVADIFCSPVSPQAANNITVPGNPASQEITFRRDNIFLFIAFKSSLLPCLKKKRIEKIYPQSSPPAENS